MRVKATPPALEKRKSPGRIRAILLAVGVHVAFFALIIFGVTWQSRPTPPVQAELWDKLPPAKQTETSSPAKPAPEPEPPKPEPVKPEPPKPEPPKPEAKPEPPKPDPKIAEKKEREKREAERREREKLEKQKQEEARKKREQEEAAKKKREEENRRKDEEKAKREAEAAREAAASARQAEIQGYIDRIKARIRGRANVPDTVTGQPEVQVRIRILPGGDVLDIAIVRSSGNRIYDAAIERAIRSAQPLPVPPADSELFPQFRDLNLNIRHER
jgi:colicin import membrane protein